MFFPPKMGFVLDCALLGQLLSWCACVRYLSIFKMAATKYHRSLRLMKSQPLSYAYHFLAYFLATSCPHFILQNCEADEGRASVYNVRGTDKHNSVNLKINNILH